MAQAGEGAERVLAAGSRPAAGAGVLLLFGATLLLSALLLFWLEPTFTRMVLPRLGGSPAVWNTALVFFQAALLASCARALAEPTQYEVIVAKGAMRTRSRARRASSTLCKRSSRLCPRARALARRRAALRNAGCPRAMPTRSRAGSPGWSRTGAGRGSRPGQASYPGPIASPTSSARCAGGSDRSALPATARGPNSRLKQTGGGTLG